MTFKKKKQGKGTNKQTNTPPPKKNICRFLHIRNKEVLLFKLFIYSFTCIWDRFKSYMCNYYIFQTVYLWLDYSCKHITLVFSTFACSLTVHSVIRIWTRWWTVHTSVAWRASLKIETQLMWNIWSYDESFFYL